MTEKKFDFYAGLRVSSKGVFSGAAQWPKVVTVIEMPRTKSGAPRFPSRADGAEAGIVSGGMKQVIM